MSNFVLKNEDSLTTVTGSIFYNKIDSLFPGILNEDVVINGVGLNSIRNDGDIDPYIIGNMFKKIQDDVGLDPIGASVVDVKEHLAYIHETNLVTDFLLSRTDSVVYEILQKARHIVCQVIYPFDKIKDVAPRVTSGALYDLGRNNDPITRFKHTNLSWVKERTTEHLIYLNIPLDNKYLYAGKNDGSYTALDFVWKNMKKGRPIGYHEPVQLAVQCGVGDFLVKRLKQVLDINVAEATDLHRFIVEYHATLGEWTICTMDQSNASENICRSLVKFLTFGPFWDLIDEISPVSILINGEKHATSVMCAQGNGFIFPLQTLIFYALIKAVMLQYGVKGDVYQYGDDSIFPVDAYEYVKRFFETLRFQVNHDKTFTGPWLESCGVDFYQQTNVRPFYVKDMPDSTDKWYHVSNGIFRVGYINNRNCWRSSAYKHLWIWCISHIPITERFYGPTELGDSVLHCSSCDRWTWDADGYKIRHYRDAYTEKGRTFPEVAHGMSGFVTSQYVPHPAFKRAGRNKLFIEDGKTRESYPPVFGIRSQKRVASWIKYPLSKISDEDDVDSVFDNLGVSSDELLRIHKLKRLGYMNTLIHTLKEVVKKKQSFEHMFNDMPR